MRSRTEIWDQRNEKEGELAVSLTAKMNPTDLRETVRHLCSILTCCSWAVVPSFNLANCRSKPWGLPCPGNALLHFG